MKRLGFYLTGNQPVERVLPLIARAALGQGQRMLVVANEAGLRDRIDEALWETAPADFLAHGAADAPHADRQPILLSDTCAAANGAHLLAIADGRWRDEAEAFDRVLLFFGEEDRTAARGTWRQFDGREDVAREFHELEGGKWVKRA
jgi:DNA polymerase-3 subunit chi